jgi:hypothetical protein
LPRLNSSKTGTRPARIEAAGQELVALRFAQSLLLGGSSAGFPGVVMRLFGKAVGVITGILLLMAPAAASAGSITLNGNGAFTVQWLETSTTPDVSGTANFVVTDFTASGFDLAITQVSNTTPTTPDINARLVSFGFGLSPDATSFTNEVNGAIFSWGFSNFPGFGTVEVCGFSGSNCAGGGGVGLDQGQSTLLNDVMSIHVNGDFTNGVTFAPIAAKFQTNSRSFELDDDLCIAGAVCSTSPVPEPASMVLLGTGLLVGATRFRRKAAK